jgi:cytochrome c oxidase subunit 2
MLYLCCILAMFAVGVVLGVLMRLELIAPGRDIMDAQTYNAMFTLHGVVMIPAFRIKMDTVPGMQTYAWFQAQRKGVYDVLCAEYCGLRHSNMLSTVEVMTEEDFRAWYEGAAAGDDEAVGLLESYGCTGCHSLDGSELAGPTLMGIYGGKRTVTDATGTREVVVDEGYLRRAILEPDAELVMGYEGMPAYKEEMSQRDLDVIIRYLTGGAVRDLDRGRMLMESEGCLSCHSTDAYLREAILDPEKFLVVGYDPIMPSYDHLSEEDVQAMIDSMHSLSDGHE